VITIYALVDPREPSIIKYVGRTAQPPRKRLSDHKALARNPLGYHWTPKTPKSKSAEKVLTQKKTFPLREWIRSVQAANLEPEQVILAQFDNLEDAIDHESDLAHFHRDTVTNSFRSSAFTSGRHVDPSARIHNPVRRGYPCKATKVDGRTFTSQKDAIKYLMAQGSSRRAAHRQAIKGAIR